ncbi:toll-like receptor 1 [Amia ocellicauda]|uniref:toll-like receptor 1 n=1 Tax=Amia ocellicauda TaxID=2972642 RepID=UPI003463C298
MECRLDFERGNIVRRNSVIFIFWSLIIGSVQELLLGKEWQYVLNYSSQGLTSIPRDLPSSAEGLDLSLNQISKINGDDFSSLPHLMFLNLSYNIIENISPESFKSNPELECLDVSHNKISNLSCDFLDFTPNLRYMDISFNTYTGMTLGDAFRSVIQLEYIALSGEILLNKDFESLADIQLRTVFLQLQNLTHYENTSLNCLNTQTVMITVTNRQTDVEVISDALSIAEEVTLLSVKNTSDYLYQAFEIQKGQKKKKASQFTFINSEMSWGAATDTLNVILNSTFIKHLYAYGFVMLGSIWEKKPIPKTSVESLTIRKASVTNFFFFQGNLYDFFINIMVKNLTIAETPIIHMTCPQSLSTLQMLDFSYNSFSESVFSKNETDCNNLTNLNTLILRGNQIQQIQKLSSRTKYMTSLKYLDLSSNSLKYESGTCHWPDSILTLNLSSNSLDHLVFNCLPKYVQILDLQNNQITTLSGDVFSLEALIELNLGSNRLLEIPHCEGFGKLGTMLLQDNSLYTVSLGFIHSCRNLTVMDVSNNPFMCTCNLKDFVSMKDQYQIEFLHWPLAYRCSYPETLNGLLLKDFHLSELSCNLILLLAAILCPIIIVTIAATILCIRLDIPWYLRMMWQWTQAKRRTVAIRHQDVPDGLLFHAFVSYSQHDSVWVKESLLPNLEEDQSFRICQHERNFIPGKSIVENIISCIEKSYRSIFVLSTNFIQSEWCHYELYFAHHQLLSENSDKIILILLEPVPQYLIPSKFYKLKNMMTKKTYMEWPQDKNKHKLFWANLRAALQIDLPTEVMAEPNSDAEGLLNEDTQHMLNHL